MYHHTYRYLYIIPIDTWVRSEDKELIVNAFRCLSHSMSLLHSHSHSFSALFHGSISHTGGF